MPKDDSTVSDERQQADRLRRRVQQLETKLKESHRRWEEQRSALKAANESRRRQILSSAVVHDLLPVRRHTIPARAAYVSAVAAEEQFAAASEPYRAALGDAGSPDTLVRTEVQRLTWWVPLPQSIKGAARDRFVAKQQFPYRSITQTREFALGPILLDIGAHNGQTSIPRVILGDVTRAYCAEPDPLNYSALVRNVVDNGLRGLVLPDRVAIGAATGQARLRRAKYPGGHHLVAESAPADMTVASCRLDDWCERLSIDPDLISFVKVDTQGWEVHVLEGASRLLGFRHIAWQLEIGPEMLAAAGSSAAELYRICKECFTDFVDLGKPATGSRCRPVCDLAEALAYVGGAIHHTDVVLFNRGAAV